VTSTHFDNERELLCSANNYHSFRDVINFRSAKSDEVEKLVKRCYVSCNSVENRLLLSGVSRRRDAELARMLTTASEDSVIDLVELNAALKQHFNVDSFTVNGRLSYKKVPSTVQKKEMVCILCFRGGGRVTVILQQL
jgi:hypothetical protein